MKRYVAIDLTVMKSLNLNLEEWVLLENIHFLENGNVCYASKDSLATHIGMSRRKIFRILSELELKGYVKRVHGGLKTTRLWKKVVANTTSCTSKKDIKEEINDINEKLEKKSKPQKTTFEKLINELKQSVPTLTDKHIQLLQDYYEYRKKIKKPIKTINPLKSYLKNLKEIQGDGYDIEEAIALMKEREWQTITLDYCKNTLKKDVEFVTW